MAPTLLYYDPVFQKHDTGAHPENPARLLPSVGYFDSLATNPDFVRATWKPATLDQLELAHTRAYIDQVREFCEAGGGQIEQDTIVSPDSCEVALMAVGAVCDAVERIDRRENRTAFCLVRPPGHHAAAERVAGFCLFNNVAVGARLATRHLGYQRVLIVDWDVHHGDGTQAIFWEDPRVAYFSMHRNHFYPFTGNENETGAGAGKGTTRNVPVRFGTPRQELIKHVENELNRFAGKMQPELVLISAGFDAHKHDPVGSLGLEAVDFATLTRIVVKLANQYSGGKIVSVLEGGYHPVAVAQCVEQHLTELAHSSTD